MATTRKRVTSGFSSPEPNTPEEDQTPTVDEQISAMLEQAPGVGDPDTHAKLSSLAEHKPEIETVTHLEKKEPKITYEGLVERPSVKPPEEEVKKPAPPKRHPRNIPKFSSATL